MLVVRTMDRVKSTDRLAPSTERRRSTSHRLSVPLCAALSCAPARCVPTPNMHAFTERIKQYPAKEQAELSVRIKVPGTGLVIRRTAHAVRAS